MYEYPSDIAFTSAVKAIQTDKGSRAAYARVERGHGWQTTVTPELTAFLADLAMFYLGTSNSEGQPYIQYRGGSEGFLKVLDEKTLAFADFGGNRQYISHGCAGLVQRPEPLIWFGRGRNHMGSFIGADCPGSERDQRHRYE